jgi:hypothetical protein
MKIKYLNFSYKTKKGAKLLEKLNTAAAISKRSPHDLAWLILDGGLNIILEQSQSQSGGVD